MKEEHLSRWQLMAVTLVLEAKRHYYNLRYFGRVRLAPGVKVVGSLRVKGRCKVVIGEETRIRQRVQFSGRGVVEVGGHTLLNGNWVVATRKVVIGSYCLISDCGISDSDYHNLAPELRHSAPTDRVWAPVRVDDNVWLGMHSLILKGVTIGADSVVGAGAVVREDVPPRTVVIGNPARVVKIFADSDTTPGGSEQEVSAVSGRDSRTPTAREGR